MAWKFVITGTRGNRAGDVARLLGQAGIDCPRLTTDNLTFDDTFYSDGGIHSEMIPYHSYQADTRLRQRFIYDSLITDETVVVHLVRNPWSVIADIRPLKLSYDERIMLLNLGVDDLDEIENPVEKAICYYVAWYWCTHAMWKRAKLKALWHLEALSFEDFALMLQLAGYEELSYVEIPHYDRHPPQKLRVKNTRLMMEFNQIIATLGY